MSKICEMKIQEDTKAYTLDVEGMRRIQDEQMESTTYVEVLSFLKDMFNLVDFSGIIKNSNKTIFQMMEEELKEIKKKNDDMMVVDMFLM